MTRWPTAMNRSASAVPSRPIPMRPSDSMTLFAEGGFLSIRSEKDDDHTKSIHPRSNFANARVAPLEEGHQPTGDQHSAGGGKPPKVERHSRAGGPHMSGEEFGQIKRQP